MLSATHHASLLQSPPCHLPWRSSRLHLLPCIAHLIKQGLESACNWIPALSCSPPCFALGPAVPPPLALFLAHVLVLYRQNKIAEACPHSWLHMMADMRLVACEAALHQEGSAFRKQQQQTLCDRLLKHTL